MGDERHPLTQILQKLDPGDAAQSEELLGLVYEELRSLARAHMRGEGEGHTLQPTELVHEAYFRLVDRPGLGWESRSHFFGAAARAMRQVLVDHARRRMAEKRGAGDRPVTLSTEIASEPGISVEILDLHRALTNLEAQDPALAKLVELRFFAGLTVEEASTTLGVSPRKAAKDWSVARLWLHRELEAD
jgi:RNA polymerase sigma factor (TIGR02999 family)